MAEDRQNPTDISTAPLRRLLRFWVLARVGNFVGALLVGWMVHSAQSYRAAFDQAREETVANKMHYMQEGAVGAWFEVVRSSVLATWMVGRAAFFAVMGRTANGHRPRRPAGSEGSPRVSVLPQRGVPRSGRGSSAALRCDSTLYYVVAVDNVNQFLPERIEGQGVLIRRWLVDDAERLSRAVAESQDHLRPWMAWIAGEPKTLEERRARIAAWNRDWADGRDFVLGVFVGERVAGGCGLHRRGGPSTLEIGYWLHPSFTGQGLATTVARLLTDAAFALPGIEHVEIHSDKANTASAGVAKRLRFHYLGETPDEATAPGEIGIDCAWRIDRDVWRARAASAR